MWTMDLPSQDLQAGFHAGRENLDISFCHFQGSEWLLGHYQKAHWRSELGTVRRKSVSVIQVRITDSNVGVEDGLQAVNSGNICREDAELIGLIISCPEALHVPK